MLTVQQLRPTATNVEDLIRSGTSIGYMGDLTSTDKQGIDKSRLKAYYSKEEFNDALSREAHMEACLPSLRKRHTSRPSSLNTAITIP
ncbi:hypothetical protein HPP92_012027 [Vanilla planifolia]|uniref:Uncharacterized protein n=1 Tax=Vanilla planifolia TaxID=51239 RepID=A0A835R5A6_VANPL|nr:hypothetical protein HPP92_012027 [Vanilla planifolia]